MMTAKPPVVDWFSKYCSTEQIGYVRTFCSDNGLTASIVSAVQIAERCFPSTEPQVTVEEDPETASKTLAIHVTIQDSVTSVLSRYEDFSQELMKLLPWPKSGMIHLYYNIV